MIAALLDHLWQSTLFAGGVALLTLGFRRNEAAVRFWLWFAASLKFLVPFAVLAAVGSHLFRFFPAALPQAILAVRPTAESLSVPARTLVARQNENIDLALLLLGLWLVGFAAILGLRLLRGLRLRAVMAGAQDVALSAPIRIKTSTSLLEPGLVGILKPVVLLPLGLMAHLSQPEREAILAHEISHLRRRDNITAAIHMVVEALFWFYPLVWLIGARLIAERERACDETVLAGGHDPEVYAGGILKVCKFCIQSPLACAPGASGADLGNRLRQIMASETILGLGRGKRFLLTGVAALALALPVMAGFLTSPLAIPLQVAAVRSLAVASFTRNVAAVEEKIGMAPTEPVQVRRLPRLKIATVAAEVLPPSDIVPVPADAPQIVASIPLMDAAEPVHPPTSAEAVLALNPRGGGDPAAITCRAPQSLPGSRFAGPEVCKSNQQWAELRARHEDISPDGRTVISLGGFEMHKSVNGQNCSVPRGTIITAPGLANTACF